ncbi:post-GPI attachment to proteins factor 2-like isoform 2-T2 [Cochliomyia hominivorax]
MSDSRGSGKRASSASRSDAKSSSSAAAAVITSAALASSNTMSTKDLHKLDLPPESLINQQTLDATKTTNVNQPHTPQTYTAETPNDFPFALHFLANFHHICVVTALLPLVTLFTCFVTAYVFQYDEVHETHCRVYNIVPSISAITGVSPQRYFWRFSIALHLGPRLPIAFIYKNYYRIMLAKLQKEHAEQVGNTIYLVYLILVLNCIEIASLGGVTYISNRENYLIFVSL